MIKKILNTDPVTRPKAGEIRKHPWYQLIESVEMEGIIVGQETIPIIEDIKNELKASHCDLEGIEYADKFIKLNKHNHITTTYYLLLKKAERDTGKNLLFEKVTFEKRNYNSTGNLSSTRPSVSQF
jgi:5'-AMP-activated protein kinase catalytic alpha subunit